MPASRTPQTGYDKTQCSDLFFLFVFCLQSLQTFLIYVDSDAKNVAMVCVRSVDRWNRDSRTVMHIDHRKLKFVFFPS